MNIFNVENKKWKLSEYTTEYTTDYSNSNRILKYNVINKLNNNFCSDKWNENNIKIIERIGSESSEGEVYKLKIGQDMIVGKILPIMDTKSLLKNQNEMEIAKKMSDEVLLKNTIYFLLVYKTLYCENTLYNPKSKFYENSCKYVLYQDNKREFWRNKNKSLDELNLNNLNNLEIPSNILISEIAWGDLREFTSRFKIEYEHCDYILKHLFNAIKFLNETMNIMHNDLHMGNVLILLNNNLQIYIPLIHDFGKSEKMKTWTMYDRITDIYKILYDMSLNPNIPNSFKNKIQKLLTYIVDIKFNENSYPILDKIHQLYLE